MAATATTPRQVWAPRPEDVAGAALTRFAERHGLPTEYAELHAWSVEHLDAFWSLLFEHFDVPGDRSVARDGGSIEEPRWFPRAEVNFAEHVLRGRRDGDLALQFASELRPGPEAWTWGDLRREVERVRSGLVALGVGRGDRVAAYLPNVPSTVAAVLATASLGATWACAAPEFRAPAVVDRLGQLEPKALLAVDGYRYAGRDHDRTGDVAAIHAQVGGELVRFGHVDGTGWPASFGAIPQPLAFERVPFAHPLWVLFSSGTTGVPKAIVHGHGGMLLEHLKHAHLHLDARAEDRVLWFTTTGWMMWNFLVGVLLTDASTVLYDGSPAGDRLWDLAEATGTTVFGASAAFLTANAADAVRPRDGRDLRVRAVGSTGSPLPPEAFEWIVRELGDDVWPFSISGGTDVCTAFLTGVPTLPVRAGELQGPALGADVRALAADGREVHDEVGELVLAQPMPCMPVALHGDEDGARLHETYFARFPGLWRHGDWVTLTSRGSAVVHGRSDATINRGGVRMGTAEIYRAVLGEDGVDDALVVDVPRADGTSWMPLFVVLADGAPLDEARRRSIAAAVRARCSPRHVPDDIIAVRAVPRTLNGKLLEVPVKRLLSGAPLEAVADPATLADPTSLAPFLELAGRVSTPRTLH